MTLSCLFDKKESSAAKMMSSGVERGGWMISNSGKERGATNAARRGPRLNRLEPGGQAGRRSLQVKMQSRREAARLLAPPTHCDEAAQAEREGKLRATGGQRLPESRRSEEQMNQLFVTR